MSEKKISIEERKKQLEAELAQIQGNIEASVSDIKEDAKNHFKIEHLVKKYPVTVLSLALVIGYVSAGRRNKSKRSSNKDESVTSSTQNQSRSIEPSVSALLMLEMKRLITQKAMTYAAEYIDDILEKKLGKSKQK
jgi:hypothetical protein